MLNESQKKRLVKSLKKIIKESMYENGISAPYFYEDGASEADKEKNSSSKRSSVMKWLATAQELHSVLAYKLYPDLTRGGARSEFSKKFRGEDDQHKPYEFDTNEINQLYHLRNDFIQRGGLNKNVK